MTHLENALGFPGTDPCPSCGRDGWKEGVDGVKQCGVCKGSGSNLRTGAPATAATPEAKKPKGKKVKHG